MNKIKQIIYILTVVLISFNYGCSNDEYTFEYKAEPKTEIGSKLVEGTDLFGQIFKDSTYTVTDGAVATEMKYLSKKGLAMSIFILNVDLNNTNISIESSMPNGDAKFGMQPMTKQATYVDEEGHKVWAGINAD